MGWRGEGWRLDEGREVWQLSRYTVMEQLSRLQTDKVMSKGRSRVKDANILGLDNQVNGGATECGRDWGGAG